MESRHLPLCLLLTGRNISPEKPFSLGHSPAFFPLKFIWTDARRSQQAETKAIPAVKRHFLPFLTSSKGLFWPFFANLFNEMERGKSYTYITKILLVKPLTQKNILKNKVLGIGLSLCYILWSFFAKCLWTEILEESHLFLNSPRKSFTSASGFLGWLCPVKGTYWRFSSLESQYKNWPNPRRWLHENGQIPEDDLPRLAKFWLAASQNLKRGYDETSSLNPSHGD